MAAWVLESFNVIEPSGRRFCPSFSLLQTLLKELDTLRHSYCHTLLKEYSSRTLLFYYYGPINGIPLTLDLPLDESANHNRFIYGNWRRRNDAAKCRRFGS